MKITADPDKTRFDIYFARDIVVVLATVAQTAAGLKLDPAITDRLLALVAEQFRLTVTLA